MTMKYELIPMAWVTEDTVDGQEVSGKPRRVWWENNDGMGMPIYSAPQSVPTGSQKPTLVAWILYDASTDKKYIKMNPADGSLAIFDSEEAAMTAKKAHYGANYKRCEYYSAPQPAPDVSGLVAIAREIVDLHTKRKVVLTVHVEALEEALDSYCKQGGGL